MEYQPFHPNLDEIELFLLERLTKSPSLRVRKHLSICKQCAYAALQLRRQIGLTSLGLVMTTELAGNAYPG